MNKFVQAMQDASNQTFTENGQLAVKSTKNSIVDLFGTIGALRTRTEDQIIDLFVKAFCEDKLIALKMLFYARDIRGGLGERRTFKVIAQYLARHYPEDMKANLHLVPEYGRWDDLYCFVGTPCEDSAFELIKNQINQDLKDVKESKKTGKYKPISLCAKWLKSVQASSSESKKLARLTARKIGLHNDRVTADYYFEYRNYILALSTLRKHIKVVERLMSTNQFDKIEYSEVPSLAMKRYKNAFNKHDEERFNKYVQSLIKGDSDAKINASTLYPYDIIRPAINESSQASKVKVDAISQAQWDALPNYSDGENNFLVVCDLSGSMYWYNNAQAAATSIGLGIYFAERNKGAFHNVCMTFSSDPEFITFKDGMKLEDKIRHIYTTAKVGYDTNLYKTMKLICDTAVKGNIPQEELPKSVVLISDMEFNQAVTDRTMYDVIDDMFRSAGYETPNIVFWNVQSRNNVFHIDRNQSGVQLASGSSPSVFKALANNIGLTPLDMVLNVLNSERYSAVRVA